MRPWDTLRGIAVVSATAILLLSGCGGSSTPTSSSTHSSDRRTPEQLAADQLVAESAILQLSDFPSGWEAKPRDPSTSDTPEAKAATNKFAECVGVDPAVVGDQSDSSKAKAKSDKFTDSHDLEVEANATVEANAGDGQQAIAAFQKPEARGCFQQFVSAALEYVLAHPDPGKELPQGAKIGNIEVGEVNLPDIHGQPVVYRATLPVTVGQLTIKVFIDFLLVLQGRTGLDLTFQNVDEPFPADLEVQLANAAIDRAPTT